MYIATFHTESGDRYFIGPFGHVPTFDEMLKHLPPDDQEYIEETAEDLCPAFHILEVPKEAGLMSKRHIVRRGK